MNKKWIIYGALILVAFIAVICFASEIQVWFMSKLTSLLIIAIAFGAGWAIGHFTGHSSTEKNTGNSRTQA